MEACLEESKVSGPYALGFLCPRVLGKVCHRYVKGGQMEAISELKQRSLSMAKYEKEFNHFSKYAPDSVLTEAFR